MAAKKSTKHHTRARAKEVVVDGTAVKNRVRQLSVGAFRDRKLSLGDVSRLVHDVLEGAVEGVDRSIPKSKKNVLREVFDGLSEGVHAVASAGSTTVGSAREKGQAIVSKDIPRTTKRIHAANNEFLSAVRSFANKTSRQVREELDALVTRAERTRPKVTESARRVVKAADGRLVELSDETARAGVRAGRRAAGTLALGASGLLEGIAEAITPKGRPASTVKKKGTRTRAAKKTAKKKPAAKAPAKKATAKKTARKKASKRRKA